MKLILWIGDLYSNGYDHYARLYTALDRSVDKYRQCRDHHNASWKPRTEVDVLVLFKERMLCKTLEDLFSQMNSRLYVRIFHNDDELFTTHTTTK